ncbi:hypothetical protein BP00DRAFT_427981, partial [Aspergillus indologenus CBS 114.80]
MAADQHISDSSTACSARAHTPPIPTQGHGPGAAHGSSTPQPRSSPLFGRIGRLSV